MESTTWVVVETGPALFAGAVCALFGAVLLVWTGVRTRHGRPVAATVAGQATAAAAATAFGGAFLATGLWLLLSL